MLEKLMFIKMLCCVSGMYKNIKFTFLYFEIATMGKDIKIFNNIAEFNQRTTSVIKTTLDN